MRRESGPKGSDPLATPSPKSRAWRLRGDGRIPLFLPLEPAHRSGGSRLRGLDGAPTCEAAGWLASGSGRSTATKGSSVDCLSWGLSTPPTRSLPCVPANHAWQRAGVSRALVLGTRWCPYPHDPVGLRQTGPDLYFFVSILRLPLAMSSRFRARIALNRHLAEPEQAGRRPCFSDPMRRAQARTRSSLMG